MDQIGRDISLLSHFNLMDYSLLFVIEYNPEYVKRYPSEFAHDSEGKLLLPVRPSLKLQINQEEKKTQYNDALKKK